MKGLSIIKYEVVKKELFRERSAVGKKYKSPLVSIAWHG